MTVSFISDVDDFTAVGMYTVRETGRLQRYRQKVAFNAWIIVAFVCAIFLQNNENYIPIATAAGVVAAVLGWFTAEGVLYQITRRHVVAYMKGEERVPVEVGIGPTGIWYRQMGMRVEIEWEKISDIRTEADSIYFVAPEHSYIRLPSSAFISKQESVEFIQSARAYIKAAARNGEKPESVF